MNAYFISPELQIASCFGAYGVWFNLGSCLLPFNQNSPGITSNYAAISPTDFGGWYTANQLINSWPSPTPSAPGDYQPTAGQYWADGCWYADYNQDAQNQAPAYTPPLITATVGPNFDAPGYNVSPSPRQPAGFLCKASRPTLCFRTPLYSAQRSFRIIRAV